MGHPPPQDGTNEITTFVRQLFDEGGSISDVVDKTGLSRASVKHYYIEWKQARDQDGSAAHATAKAELSREAVRRVVPNPRVLELFAGPSGFLTKTYESEGCQVTAFDKRLGTGDSYLAVHRLVADGHTFDIVDIDPYGYPFRLFPHAFQLIDKGVMLVTIPKTGCNHGNNITWQMLQVFTGSPAPSLEQLLTIFWGWGLQYWREVNLIRGIEFDRIWRLLLDVKKVKATEFCGVRNRPEMAPSQGLYRVGPDLSGIGCKMLPPEDHASRELFDLAMSDIWSRSGD